MQNLGRSHWACKLALDVQLHALDITKYGIVGIYNLRAMVSCPAFLGGVDDSKSKADFELYV